ncbi:MAG: 4Fe-4S binding protein [Gemmatales bacterium]|nr:4Fe-4S binding protein [Gemmatales bacterium]MDW8385601.1 4Fe-4S dicluster domain-containing protein [Gemmatales bacterium]
MNRPHFASAGEEGEIVHKLPPRPGDIEIPAEQLTKLLGLFRTVKANLGLKTNPDALRLRYFQAGEIICSRGEPGNSAFYVLPADDLAALYAHLSAQQTAQNPSDPQQVTRNRETLTVLDRVRQASEKRARLSQESRQLQAELESLESALAQGGDPQRAALYARCRLAGPITKLVRAELLREQEPKLSDFLGRLAELEEQRRVAVARVPTAPLAVRRQQSFWQRLLSGWRLPRAEPEPSPLIIPNDGPAEIDYDSGEASLFEDEVFGEMACIDRQPRTATVEVVKECFVLEMLRPILDNMRKDASYRKKMDDKYRERVLELHLRALPLFKDLDFALITRVRREADLEPYEAGTLICDQFERSDALYLIRSGTVKVMQNVSALLSQADVRDWNAVAQLDPDREGPFVTARQRIWVHLPAALTESIKNGSVAVNQHRQLLLDAINDLICDPLLLRDPDLRETSQAAGVHAQTWRLLVTPDHANPEKFAGFNRVLLAAALLGKPTAWRVTPGMTPESLPGPLEAGQVADWKQLAGDLEPSQRKADHPATSASRWLWDQLPADLQERVRRIKTGSGPTPEDMQRITAILNDVAERSFPLVEPEFQDLIANEVNLQSLVMRLRQDGQKWTDHAWRRFSRLRNRLLMHALYPAWLGAEYRPPGRPLVLAYRGRGEILGEIGLMLNEPRSATCVAYNHPDNDPAREVGPVQLVRISKELFQTLREKSPLFRQRIEETIRERLANTRRRQQEAERAARTVTAPLDATAEQLGISQGQRLMLIDLDRCVRCDECVRACVAAHDDGVSRLFLDGPRFQQHIGNSVRTFLAPTTCRSCVDPVCMIPCPVGSIIRGEQGQILIRDWCIGCEKCAKNCPYGAIQMHPAGLVPARSSAWQFLPSWKLPADCLDWTMPEYRSRKWQSIQTPVTYDQDFLSRLGRLTPLSRDVAVCFRHVFSLDVSRRRSTDAKFRLVIAPLWPNTRIWINGREITDLEAKKGEGLRELELDDGGEVGFTEAGKKPAKSLRILRPGSNAVGVRVPLPDQLGGTLFDLKIVVFEGTVIEFKAVVCDLCNQPPGTLTACVRACPHEATRRFDARNGVIAW